MEFSVTLILAGLVLAFFWFILQKRKYNLPPGPTTLPLVGNLPQLDKKQPFKSFTELSKSYGPVMTLYLGWQRTVVLTGYEVVKEALVDQAEDFTGRGPLPFLLKATNGYGLGISNGERWRQLRRFTLSTLRDFGMGRKGMEEWIQEESKHLTARIKTLKVKPFDPTFLLSCTVSNVICCMVFGERFSYDDKQFLELLHVIAEVLRFNSSFLGQMYNVFPWILEHLPGPQHTMFSHINFLREFIKKKIQEHKESLDPSSPRDYIDTFLIRMEQEKNLPNTEFHYENLVSTVLNLFLAGTETTSSTLRYALGVLIKHPNVQEEMQREIDNVVRQDQCPKMEDRKSLPFTDAVIHEVQRFLDIVPFGLPHYALKDISFRGYSIPKGTVIIPLLHSVLKGDQWETPWAFNPKHFLDQNGSFKKNPAFLPFSAGRESIQVRGRVRAELQYKCSRCSVLQSCLSVRSHTMDLTVMLLTATLLLVVLWILNAHTRKHTRLPPGPRGIPVLGNLLQLDKKAPFKSLLKLSENYGPVLTVALGPQRTVVLVGYEAVKDALVDHADDFTGRGPVPFLKKVTRGYGLAISNGERWRQLRRFTLTTLRDFGMGRKGMEEWIQEESKHLVTRIKATEGVPFDPTFFLSCTVSNVICCLVFGQRFSYDDEHLLSLLHIISETIQFGSSASGLMYNLFPRLMEWLPGRHREMFGKIEKVRAFTMEKIEEHQDTLDPSSPRDYIDCFLMRLQQEKHQPNTEFNYDNLVSTVLNLYLAGTETTSSTIRYALNVLIRHPKIQEKMQEEIDSVIGQGRCPYVEDRKSLPFTDAVLHEIQRYLDMIPFSIPHYALQDISFRGYTIPKDTLIIPLLHSVLKDDKMWETPGSFNPQHFLDGNGSFKKNPAFLPFSAGKRACVGESLARMEIFLFVVSLVQHFTLSCPGGPDSVDLTPEYSSFANVPRKYKIIATPRWQ